jgi:hypothetical protein
MTELTFPRAYPDSKDPAKLDLFSGSRFTKHCKRAVVSSVEVISTTLDPYGHVSFVPIVLENSSAPDAFARMPCFATV